MALATQINHYAEFAEAMQSYGLALEEGPIDDGQIHRFRVNGDKASSLNGWYILFSDDLPAGRFGCWKRGIDETWCSKKKQEFTKHDREAYQRSMKRAQAKREKEKKRVQSEAAVECQKLWNIAEPANPKHLYLASKSVGTYGIRQIDHSLLVPVRNQEGVICSLQFINQTGEKHFKSGGRISGCYHSIGKLTERLYLCEGYATGATTHEATGCGVIVAFNVGNLKPVAETIKKKYPDRELVIAADNDHQKQDNIGLAKGRETAQALSLSLVYPTFEEDEIGSDFNDLADLRGLDMVCEALEAVEQPNDEEECKKDEEVGADVDKRANPSSQSTLLVEIGRGAELWHDPESIPYATIQVGDHREHWAMNSRGYKEYLRHQFYLEYKRSPSSQAMTDAMGVLTGIARYEGQEHKAHLRIGEHQGKYYLDLCVDDWRYVEIDASGWCIVSGPDIRFIRRRGMLALPTPTPGGNLNDFWPLINVAEEERPLLCAWLVAALKSTGPYPVLILQGEQGTAKSTLARALRSLIDPSVAMLRTMPREERDLIVAARNSWVIAIDNLSGLKPWLADSICRLATGGGYSARELYSDAEEVLIDVQRPCILNGIDDIATRQDLIDRSIILNLQPIPENCRKPEAAYWKELEVLRSGVLGALCDAISTAISNLPTVDLCHLPRMADFALWATAAEPAMGCTPGQFMEVYAGNRRSAIESGLEGSPVYQALSAFMEDKSTYNGTATDLLKELGRHVSDRTRNLKSWPKSARGLSNQLRRLATGLRAVGIDVEFTHSGTRTINILRVSENASNTSNASNPSNGEASSVDAAGRMNAGWTQAGRTDNAQNASQGPPLDDMDAPDAEFPVSSNDRVVRKI